MPDTRSTVGQLAEQIRSKNAGPFWTTIDIFLRNDEDYERLLATHLLTPECLGRVYHVKPDRVQIFEIPRLRAVKISYPRLVTAGSFDDRDLHAGQQHLPLSRLALPPASDRQRTPPATISAANG